MRRVSPFGPVYPVRLTRSRDGHLAISFHAIPLDNLDIAHALMQARLRDLYRLGSAYLVRARVASPAMATAVEELCVLGARAVIHVGSAGGLIKGQRLGSVVVSSGAINETGTGVLYGYPMDLLIPADGGLTDALFRCLQRRQLDVLQAAHWVTDAVYCETAEKVQRYRERGAVCVEMEAAGLYAAARRHGVPAAAAYVISDSLAGERWVQGWSDPQVEAGTKQLASALVEWICAGGPN